ncbi:MAG: hypothetical protein HYR90_02125 [Candidatus Andersenbacteria bacterium]|nr:hypothetical protein [Candidatus Andersenbacteria bacterium]MBI3250958.1 hypothetical protein [Candidatus Andersenbacteria bacterium]
MKSLWIDWSIRIGILILVCAGLYILHNQAMAARNAYTAAINELEQTPLRLLESASRAADLSRREFDISRIQHLLVPRNQIVDVVSAIEAQAKRHQVEVSIPEIVESEEAGGVIQDITVRVSVDGNPENIVDFSHSVEHLPYLLNVERWSLSTRSFAVPQSAAQAPTSRTTEVTAITGHAEIEIIVVVSNTSDENPK